MAKNAPGREAGSLWAITSYFNPTGYSRRLANYRLFRERLIVPLVTVELAYGPDFELNASDAEILVQLHGRDIMWQKERLLNLALQSLPSHCTNVVWVDCDVIFEMDDWPEQVKRSLERFVVLQPFSHGYSLPRDCVPGKMRRRAAEWHESISFAIASGVPAAICVGEIPQNGLYSYDRGLAWVARRELLDQHGFYDACIVGGGDRAMGGAVHGYYDAVVHPHLMNERQRVRYLDWAKPFHKTIGAAAGWMNGNIYHLWHGEKRDRGYQERHEKFTRFEFDPFKDITIDDSGSWRWNTDKPQMHRYVREYFFSRKEDS